MAVANCLPAKPIRSRKAKAAAGSPGSPITGTGGQSQTPQAPEPLLGIVQDDTADPRVRSKAARKIAEFLLPKTGRKEKALADEYGFRIKPSLASRYRDIELEVRALMNDWKSRLVPVTAEKLKKLQARSAAIRARVEAPCPTRYGNEAAAKDYARVLGFYRLRNNKIALTEAQSAEEALAKMRLDVFANDPEAVGRRRRRELENAERRYKESQVFREFNAPPLSCKEKNELNILRWLYPKPSSDRSEIDDDEDEDEFCLYSDHPFYYERPAADGNLYPRDSKPRPAKLAGDPLLKKVEGPPISPAGPSDAPAQPTKSSQPDRI